MYFDIFISSKQELDLQLDNVAKRGSSDQTDVKDLAMKRVPVLKIIYIVLLYNISIINPSI